MVKLVLLIVASMFVAVPPQSKDARDTSREAVTYWLTAEGDYVTMKQFAGRLENDDAFFTRLQKEADQLRSHGWVMLPPEEGVRDGSGVVNGDTTVSATMFRDLDGDWEYDDPQEDIRIYTVHRRSGESDDRFLDRADRFFERLRARGWFYYRGQSDDDERGGDDGGMEILPYWR